MLIDAPPRFDGAKVIGVDEHVWRHTRHGDKYVTVIIDLPPVRQCLWPRDHQMGPPRWAVELSVLAVPRMV